MCNLVAGVYSWAGKVQTWHDQKVVGASISGSTRSGTSWVVVKKRSGLHIP